MHNVPSTPRRARFSLRTLLLAMVIAALAIAQYVVLRRVREVEVLNRQLFDENVKLRVEAGYLTIQDRRKAAVLQLEDLDELTWRWKVFLPKGNWVMHAETSNVPQKGLMKSGNVLSTAGDRQIVVTATVRKGANDRWQLATQFNGSGARHGLDEKHALIPGAGAHTAHSTNAAGNGKQETLDPDQPIVLLRLRTHESIETSPGSWTSKERPEPTDGILIWIERQK